MSNDFAVKLHQVPFHSTHLLLIDYHDAPYVPLKPVIDEIGLDWRSRIIQRALKRFKSGLVEICTISPDGFVGKMKCLPLRKVPAWLLGIESLMLPVTVRKKLVLFQDGCDDILWLYWSRLRASAEPPVSFIYEDRQFRFQSIGNENWYVATDVVAALGIRDTKSLLRTVPTHMQRVQLLSGRRLNTINQAGLERALLLGPPSHTERLRVWLDSVFNRAGRPRRSCALLEAGIEKECADLTLDYLSQSRAAMRKAGLEPIEWDEARAQQVAAHLPWLLIRNQRWLLTLSEEGKPQLSCVPSSAGIFTPENIVEWVRDRDGVAFEMLPDLLAAIGERLSSRQENTKG